MKTNKKITNTFNQNSSVFAVFKPHQLKKKNQNNFNLDVEKITATRITNTAKCNSNSVPSESM